MSEILSLFSVFSPYLSTTSLRQFCGVVFAVLAMTGRVNMRNISRWTSEGGSYRTVQRFFNTLLPWGTLCWVFFRTYLFEPESAYILAGDETVVSKAGTSTYGVSRFFSSLYGKSVPSVAFFAVSIISVKQRQSYPLLMEQIVKPAASKASCEVADPQKPPVKRKRGRPKGSRNRNKTDVVFSDTLKLLQTMVNKVLAKVGDSIPLRYFVLDGYFGHHNALQMTQHCGLHLISKLRRDAALYFPPTTPSAGSGRPRIYGERVNPQEIDTKHLISTQTEGNIKTEVYQMRLRHKHFADPLNVVCILKTHTATQHKSHVLLFSSDMDLEAETLIDYYALRFQIEFNFRDAKQYWGLDDFINVKQTPVNTAAKLSMFMVNVAAKLKAPFRSEQTAFGILDLKARYRGMKYLHEILKILPQKPETIVIDEIAEHLGTIGAIHYTPPRLNPG